MRRRARTTFALAAALLLPSSLVAACSSSTGGVMVVMRTDMTFPATVKVVGLYIDQITDGRRTSLLSQEVPTSTTTTGTTVSLPSNLAIQNDGDSSQVRVRVVAYDLNMVPIAMRESQASVTNTRLDAMPMPLLWMNGDDVVEVNQDANPMTRLQSSTCGADRTLGDDGACVSIETELEPYEPTAPVEIPAGQCNPDCFDVSACFKPEFAEDVDEDYKAARAPIGWFDQAAGQCGVALGTHGDAAKAVADREGELSKTLAVAVRVAREEGATCTKQDPNECYIVLDAASNMSVTRKTTPQGERLWALLPAGICRKWAAGKIYRDTAVAVPGCSRKLPNQTLCGENEVGCTTDLGWDGSKNPRAPKQGTPPAASAVCLVPGATSLSATSDSLVAMNDQGQIVALPPTLENCAPATTGAALGAGTYRFAGVEQDDTLAFMRQDGVAGTATPSAGGYVPTLPDGVLATTGPWGVGFAAAAGQPCFLGPGGGFFGEKTLQADSIAFTATSNGLDAPSAEGITFLTSDGSSLALVQCPASATGPNLLARRQPNPLPDPQIPLHAAGLGGHLFVLTQGDAGAPGLVRYDGSFEQPLQRVGLALPASEAPMAAIPWEMTLAAGAQSLFFGDASGRIYRITPGAGPATSSEAQAEVVYRGYESVHSVYYASAKSASGPRVAGYLYFLTWPDGNAALARIQRIPLDAVGAVVIPEPVADGGSSSGDLGSSSSGSSTSSGNVSSGSSSSSGGSSTSSSGGSSTSSSSSSGGSSSSSASSGGSSSGGGA